MGPKNRLLTALPERDRSNLRRQLEAVPLVGGSTLFDVNEPLTRLYFMETGVAALLTTLEVRAVGVAVVGREGVVDAHTLLLGGNASLGRCQVLVPGSALTMEVSAFRSALNKSPMLRAACEAYTRSLLAQILQAVPCNRLHTVEQRCARWLLMCADRTADDGTSEVIRDALAPMLSVAQPTLAIVLRRLQSDGLICCRRGAVTILDREGLETAACECYRIVRDRDARALAYTF